MHAELIFFRFLLEFSYEICYKSDINYNILYLYTRVPGYLYPRININISTLIRPYII